MVNARTKAAQTKKNQETIDVLQPPATAEGVFSAHDFDAAIASAVGVRPEPPKPATPKVTEVDIRRAESLMETQVALQRESKLPPEKVWVEIVLPEGYERVVYDREFSNVLVGIRRAAALKGVKVRRQKSNGLAPNVLHLRFTSEE